MASLEIDTGPVSPPQIRAARAFLGWSRKALGLVAGVSPSTIKAVESGYGDPRTSTLEKLRRTLEQHGIVFVSGADALGVGRRRVDIAADLRRPFEEKAYMDIDPSAAACGKDKTDSEKSFQSARVDFSDKKSQNFQKNDQEKSIKQDATSLIGYGTRWFKMRSQKRSA